MIKVKYDLSSFNKTMKNATDYSLGFVEGVRMNRANFNNELGQIAVKMLGKYIDSRARADTDSLHHVYEWGGTGNEGARLFNFNVKASAQTITIFGEFLPSKSISDTSDEPFVNKAEVMENAILIEITPKNNVLAFEADGGETVFTADTVYVANPGGDGVAGSFGRVVEEFFDVHFTAQVLMQTGIMKKLSKANEFTAGFAAGGGRNAGIGAGKRYLTTRGIEFR
jgi:hypothetical protein